jgi:hypothetical protein
MTSTSARSQFVVDWYRLQDEKEKDQQLLASLVMEPAYTKKKNKRIDTLKKGRERDGGHEIESFVCRGG